MNFFSGNLINLLTIMQAFFVKKSNIIQYLKKIYRKLLGSYPKNGDDQD